MLHNALKVLGKLPQRDTGKSLSDFQRRRTGQVLGKDRRDVAGKDRYPQRQRRETHSGRYCHQS